MTLVRLQGTDGQRPPLSPTEKGYFASASFPQQSIRFELKTLDAIVLRHREGTVDFRDPLKKVSICVPFLRFLVVSLAQLITINNLENCVIQSKYTFVH